MWYIFGFAGVIGVRAGTLHSQPGHTIEEV